MNTLRWLDALIALLSIQVAYWFALGGWLRTPWGQPHLDDYRRPGPQPISPPAARAYVAVAGACASAAAVAFAYQSVSVR